MEFVPSPFVCGDAVAYRFGIKVTLSFLHVCPRANQRRKCQWISNSNSLHHDVTFKMIMSLCFWWYVHLPLSPKHTQWKYWLVLGIHPIPWDRTFCMSMQYASNAHDSCAKADGMSLFLRHLCVSWIIGCTIHTPHLPLPSAQVRLHMDTHMGVTVNRTNHLQ